MFKVTMSEDEFNNIIDCVRQCYESYTGDSEIDQDVYEFNSNLDNLIHSLNEGKERI